MRGTSGSGPFLTWCASQGCDLSKVELRESTRDSKDFVNDAGDAIGSADDSARGRGVYTKVDIKAGEHILTVPYTACIAQGGLGRGAGSLDGATPPFENATPAECLAWNLLEARGGDKSETWKAYVEALPVSIDSPTSGLWDRKEVAELQVSEAVFKAALTLGKDGKAAKNIAARGGIPGGGDDGEVAKRWSWALACVRSRAIELAVDGGTKQSLLVPFVDMLNHMHVEPNTEWTTTTVDGSEKEGTTSVVIVAKKDIPAGDELTISYATETSLDSFCLYMGFLGGHNQWDSVELFKTLRHAAKWYSQTFKSEQGETVVDLQKAFAVADAFGKQTGRADDELRLGWGGRVADVLVDMLVYFNKQIMSDEDPEKMAAHAVKVRCDELLTAMPTTPDADLEWLEKMSKDGDATGDATEKARMERKKLAVEYRLRKKGLLMHFIEG
ncbi:SET domain-containing protein [bacterium]|nr:SET domain-containing protein [bacterium]